MQENSCQNCNDLELESRSYVWTRVKTIYDTIPDSILVEDKVRAYDRLVGRLNRARQTYSGPHLSDREETVGRIYKALYYFTACTKSHLVVNSPAMIEALGAAITLIPRHDTELSSIIDRMERAGYRIS